jgi:hypothetical protein
VARERVVDGRGVVERPRDCRLDSGDCDEDKSELVCVVLRSCVGQSHGKVVVSHVRACTRALLRTRCRAARANMVRAIYGGIKQFKRRQKAAKKRKQLWVVNGEVVLVGTVAM